MDDRTRIDDVGLEDELHDAELDRPSAATICAGLCPAVCSSKIDEREADAGSM